MSIFDELTGGSTASCKICAYLDGRPVDEVTEFQRAMALPIDEVSNQRVVEVLKTRGVTITESSVRRHRRNHLDVC
jgi:hypothetical protein